MKWTNDVTDILNISYPIIQAPMFGVTTSKMVAAASEVGGLGSLPLGSLSADQCVKRIQDTKKLTDKPFSVNIFVNKLPEMTKSLKEDYFKVSDFVVKVANENQLKVEIPEIVEQDPNRYREQIDAIIEENCKILSFTFGVLDENIIEKLKSKDVVLIGTCTSVSEALILKNLDVDLICVQGLEAGGHRGSFEEDSIQGIGGFSLLNQVYNQVKIPLIYAGGVCNGQTFIAAQTLGAQAVQIGSLFLGSAESGLEEFEKEVLRNINPKDIVLTKAYSGRYARGYRNEFVKRVEQSGFLLPYPYQNILTGELRRVSRLNKNTDFLSLWVGQSISDFSGDSISVIIKRLIDEVENISLNS